MSDTCSKKQHQGLWILYKDTDSYLQVKWVMMIINQAVCLTMNVTSYWCLLSKAQYTPPTRRNCRVSSRRRCVHEFATSWRQVSSCRRCEHTRRQSWPSLQFPVLTTDKWRHNDVVVEKNCKNSLHSRFECLQTCSVIKLRDIVLLCHWLQNCKLGHGRRLRCASALPNPSAVVANSCTHRQRRRDKTVSSRRRCVGTMYTERQICYEYISACIACNRDVNEM